MGTLTVTFNYEDGEDDFGEDTEEAVLCKVDLTDIRSGMFDMFDIDATNVDDTASPFEYVALALDHGVSSLAPPLKASHSLGHCGYIHTVHSNPTDHTCSITYDVL